MNKFIPALMSSYSPQALFPVQEQFQCQPIGVALAIRPRVLESFSLSVYPNLVFHLISFDTFPLNKKNYFDSKTKIKHKP